MDLVTLLIFAGALIVAAGSPGPSIAALVAHVLSRGWHDVFPFLAAMWIGEAIWLTGAVFGLAAIAGLFHNLFVAIKFAGIAYLFWLAWRMWCAPIVDRKIEIPKRRSPVAMFVAGLGITLGNPKIMVFYLALLPTLVDLATLDFTGWLGLVIVMVAVLAVVDLVWVAFATVARSFLQTPRARRATNKLSAGLMAGAATLIAVRS